MENKLYTAKETIDSRLELPRDILLDLPTITILANNEINIENHKGVVIFEEETPYELIKLIKPHTLVKGGDYEGKVVVGQDIANELKLVQFVDGKSTTNTIKRIQQSETNN